MLLGTLGISAFEPVPTAAPSAVQVSHVFSLAGDGYAAKCALLDGDFVVKAGSVARIQEAPSLSASSVALRKELLSSGVVVKEPAGFRFTQDYAFGSASGAAQVICGANVSGKAVWKLPDGTTLKQLQEPAAETEAEP